MVYGSFLPRMPQLLAGDSTAILRAGKGRRNSFHNICLREGPGICIFPEPALAHLPAFLAFPSCPADKSTFPEPVLQLPIFSVFFPDL